MRRYNIWLLSILLATFFGCSGRNSDRDTVYMASTIHALVEGLFDGEISIGELKRHGDIGMGAVDHVDGELVLVDGIAYRVKADGTVAILQDTDKTPYALATPFDADYRRQIDEEVDFEQLKQRLDSELGRPGLPYAFRIEGTFSYVKTRSVPGQHKPYPRLIELIKKQPLFELQNVPGIIVGFRLPEHLESLAVPGYHFHFLTADRKTGGHLLAFRAAGLRIAADLSPTVHTVLPENEAFSSMDFSKRSREELDQIMGRIPLKP